MRFDETTQRRGMEVFTILMPGDYKHCVQQCVDCGNLGPSDCSKGEQKESLQEWVEEES